MIKEEVEIPADLIRLHDEVIELGSNIQKTSSLKLEKEHHIENNVYVVFYKVGAFGITLHRAVLSLCQDGWTHLTPLLLRALLECSVNCLVVVNNELPEYMAFKYLYYPYIKLIRDEEFPKNVRDKAKQDLDQGLDNLKNPKAKEKSIKFITTEKLPLYWFSPEENNISSIIEKYGSSEQKFIYKSLSTSTHGYHFGIGLFKDNSDVITIDPMSNPERTKMALLFSSRYLLELINIRESYEKLGFESEYHKLLDKIISFKPEK